LTKEKVKPWQAKLWTETLMSFAFMSVKLAKFFPSNFFVKWSFYSFFFFFFFFLSFFLSFFSFFLFFFFFYFFIFKSKMIGGWFVLSTIKCFFFSLAFKRQVVRKSCTRWRGIPTTENENRLPISFWFQAFIRVEIIEQVT
jgi:hypothetical protein